MPRAEFNAGRDTENISTLGYLEHCLDLKSCFENPPEVRLELISQALPGKPSVGAVDIAVTSAFQCYSPGISVMKPREDERSLDTAGNTLDAGHHTTRMHALYAWKLIGVTRSVTHDIFHSYPFYNTSQQSQRYVEAKAGNYQVPAGLTEDQRTLFVEAANFANSQYFEILSNLRPEVETRLRFQDGQQVESKLEEKAAKICQEIARYILPIGQLTIYDHSLTELQLLRLFHASRLENFSNEARFVIAEMIRQVALVDPSILKELRQPVAPMEQRSEINESYIVQQQKEFDAFLDGRLSRMKEPGNIRATLAQAGRNVLGVSLNQMSDGEILSLMMNPQKNYLLADVYEVGMHDPLTSCLREASLTFATGLSHTADSQRQRHRRTPGATPGISRLYNGSADYQVPLVVREDERLSELYDGIMTTIYGNIQAAIEAGIPREQALLLLPNAQTIRVVEQGDLFDWLHRWKQRLCYNAQEEIFSVSVDQIEQVSQFFPEAAEMLFAPCGIRQKAEIKPRCPEGTRWCGQPVYNFAINEYKKNRLI